MQKKLLVLLGILVLVNMVKAEITINEIMYDPSTEQGSDSDLEWIELYSDKFIDLSDWKIDNYNFDDYNISAEEYVIVARDKNSFLSYYNSSINYTVLDGYFSLSNTGDSINLSNGSFNVLVSYTNFGGDGNGRTLEYYDGEWYESFNVNGTPGLVNSVFGYNTDYSVIKINEFMVDAIGDDDASMPNGEWVELYNSGNMDINLGGLVLYDEDDSHELYITNTNTLKGVIIKAKDYLVIYRNKDSDFNLNDEGMDEVRLYPGYPVEDFELIDSVIYSGSIENKSWALINGVWERTLATPGKNNINVSFEYDYSVVKINEFLADPLGDDNSAMPNGEWIELYNSGENEVDMNGMYLMDSNNQKLYVSQSTTLDDMFIEGNNYLIVYVNGQNGFLNNEGLEKLRLFDKDGNFIDEVEYSGCREGVSWSDVKGVWQQTMPTLGEANIGNETGIDSYIKIGEIYDLGTDKKAKFGQVIRVKLEVFKGSTSKNSIKLFAEDSSGERISKESKTNVYTYFTNYTLTLPLQLEPNCDYDYEDGNYNVVVQGLDVEDRISFEIEDITDDLCEEIYLDKEENSKSFVYELVFLPEKINVGKDFESNIKIINNEEEGVKVEIWSYVYRGNTAYSGDREKNKKEDFVRSGDTLIVDLSNKVENAEPGLYKYKVKIIKNDQKTAKEITRDIMVDSEKESCEVINSNVSGEEIEGLEEYSKNDDIIQEINLNKALVDLAGKTVLTFGQEPRVIYQSTTYKAKEMVFGGILFLLLVLLVHLIWKKDV